ncbi:MAG: 4-hydroxybenzoate octaprenyltransferase [Candidatus Omnitrophota bacterium]|jgi:4-hydroxybenzoate polyprenyltransferase|nr:MAG: 4-hydroxybenzoate octaprenyltransferase [Candidatus Omnitrophota bacterium]
MILDRLRNYLGLVRFAHTIFALPFAFMSALVAANGIPSTRTLGWILFCMVTARTSAMTFNRIADRELDRANPRTQTRHLPAGHVSLTEAIMLWLFSSTLFVFGAWMLNPLCFALSFPTLVIICGYSYFKRFSSFSHFVLGLSLAIAPVGAWIAVTGRFSWEPLLLAAGVLLWVAGFDVIYALMDEEFDKKTGLHSLVVRYGKHKALKLAFTVHCLSVIMIALFGWAVNLGWIFFLGAAGFAALVFYEHSLVSPDDISRANIAFFHVNGVISIGLFIFTAVDLII